MSVRINGINNLLSGFYDSIIIRESRVNGNFNINVKPCSFYRINELDNNYSHITFDGLTDIEKIKKILEYYIYNNDICILDDNASVKGYGGRFIAINAYKTLIDGNLPYGRALFLDVNNQEIKSLILSILDNYNENRMRRLNDIINCNAIYVTLNYKGASYFIKNNKAYINLNNLSNSNLPSISLSQEDLDFFKILVYEFYRVNNVPKSCLYTIYGNDTLELYDKEYKHSLTFDNQLFSLANDARSCFYQDTKELDNITIDEYLAQSKCLKKK